MKQERSYIENVYRWGMIWNLSVMLILLAFPLAVCILFRVFPDWAGLWGGLVATAPMYWAVGVV